MDIRNIAIIAHVDHGKTTLVDEILKLGNIFSERKETGTRVMDSNEQEKERGITIYSKNASIEYKESKINIVDTPGHADFGSEVERVLKTVDATILLVDAYEGPMPQTKFVLKKSLEQGKRVLVVINKIDKSSARPDWVVDQVFDLFVKLGASDEQLDFAYMYTIARDGIAVKNLEDEHKDFTPLLDFILENVPPTDQDLGGTFLMQPTILAYDNFLGRIAIGRVHSGQVKVNQRVTVLTPEGEKKSRKISKLFTFKGMDKVAQETVSAGDIVAIAGIADVYVGQTITDDENATPIESINIDPPSLAMYFMVNNSPLGGREGKFLTSRQIRARLERELETNVGLGVEFEANSDLMKVLGRGEMHLEVLIETMRREGFELQISQPEIIFQEVDGKKLEPVENALVNVPDEFSGKVIEIMSRRKGELKNMTIKNGLATIEFDIPSRGLLGLRSNFIILTKGEGTIYSTFSHMTEFVGPIEKRQVGSMISGESGNVTAYALWNLQERGSIFIDPGTKVYEGMIIGEHNQGSDLTVNPIKGKKLTNMRTSGTDEAVNLVPPIRMTLEKSLEYIKDDEYVEVTPLSVRLRKKFLTETDRRRNR